MQLRLEATKPVLRIDLPPLCGFRTSKNFLWCLVRDRLEALQEEREEPLLALDAACHALISRGMFPAGCRYYGLDVARGRLEDGVRRGLPDDRLYWADLTRPLPLEACFDAVVSCNTFSHLPLDQQRRAAENLISACRCGGHLLVNTSVDAGLMPLTAALLGAFEVVEPIYFDSFRSEADEAAGRIDDASVGPLTLRNEQSLPNDACLHSQVLLHAHRRRTGAADRRPPRSSALAKILRLNAVPLLERRWFRSDKELLGDGALWREPTLTLLTKGLAESPEGEWLRRHLGSVHRTIGVLERKVAVPADCRHLVVLGLEQPWTREDSGDRLAINRMREMDGLAITFALVQERGGQRCQPSLVASDL